MKKSFSVSFVGISLFGIISQFYAENPVAGTPEFFKHKAQEFIATHADIVAHAPAFQDELREINQVGARALSSNAEADFVRVAMYCMPPATMLNLPKAADPFTQILRWEFAASIVDQSTYFMRNAIGSTSEPASPYDAPTLERVEESVFHERFEAFNKTQAMNRLMANALKQFSSALLVLLTFSSKKS